MPTFLIRSAASQSSNYPIVLTRLGGSRSKPNPHLKFVEVPGIEPATSWSVVRFLVGFLLVGLFVNILKYLVSSPFWLHVLPIKIYRTICYLTERNANHIIPSYCHLPVSCRSLVDRCSSLGSSKPQIYFFKKHLLNEMIWHNVCTE